MANKKKDEVIVRNISSDLGKNYYKATSTVLPSYDVVTATVNNVILNYINVNDSHKKR